MSAWTEELRWYTSKIDGWILAVLCLPPALAVAACIAALLDGAASRVVAGLGATGLVAGAYWGLVFPVRYAVGTEYLIVRFGVCQRRIRLADIREVRPTHNPLSSPALSLDRLRVQYGPRFFEAVIISPVDREAFLEELARKAGLARIGDRLVRG